MVNPNLNSHWTIQLNNNQEIRSPNQSENQIYHTVSSGSKPNPSPNPIHVKVCSISGSQEVHFAQFRTSVSKTPFLDLYHPQTAILEHCKRCWVSCRIRLQTSDTCPGIILWMFFRLITRRGSLCSGLEVGFGTISDWFADRKHTNGQQWLRNLSFCQTSKSTDAQAAD